MLRRVRAERNTDEACSRRSLWVCLEPSFPPSHSSLQTRMFDMIDSVQRNKYIRAEVFHVSNEHAVAHI